VYGSVVGMFEQNNLALNIPSPARVYLGLCESEEAPLAAADRAALRAQVRGQRRRSSGRRVGLASRCAGFACACGFVRSATQTLNPEP